MFESWALVAVAALLGSTLAGVTGFGGAAILLPPLVLIFGVKEAIPILTVAQLIGNASRVYFHRKSLDWKVVGYFGLAAVPSAILGAYLFSIVNASWILRVLGAFLLTTALWRHSGARKIPKFPAAGFLGVGAVFSFLSAIVGSVGPFIVPFFLSYGLVKSAFIGTEALCTVLMHIAKIAIYGRAALLSFQSASFGLALGPLMILGSWTGKKIVDRIPERVFVILVETTLVLAGLNFLFIQKIR